MTSPGTPAAVRPDSGLTGQTVVVIGGSAGIGYETARHALAEGAGVILTACHEDRLQQAAAELGAHRNAVFDATDFDQLEEFFQSLGAPIDHVLVTGPAPYYAPLAALNRQRAHRDFDAHPWLPIAVAQQGRRPGAARRHAGFHGRHRRPRPRPGDVSHRGGHSGTACADRQPSGRGGTGPGQPHRGQLRATLPIGRVPGPADIAALALHLMVNTAVTGATFDSDGGNWSPEQEPWLPKEEQIA